MKRLQGFRPGPRLYLLMLVLITLLSLALGRVKAQAIQKQVNARGEESLAAERARVEANIDDMKLHEAFIRAAGLTSPVLETQYASWIARFPNSVTVPFAIGTAYFNAGSPKARKYLQQVVSMDTSKAIALQMLSIDARRWGDESLARDYISKAARAAPDSASYALSYAMTFEKEDPAKWKSMVQGLARKFPRQEVGAQGLYWLGKQSTDIEEKISVLEQLRSSYSPDIYKWSDTGMTVLYDLYLQYAPEKAITLAGDMSKKPRWAARLELATSIMDSRVLTGQGKYKEADKLLSLVNPPRFSDAADMIILSKADAANGAGKTQQAYEMLVSFFAKTPSDEVSFMMNKYGEKLGKTKAQVQADVLKIRNESARPAPPFKLGLYSSAKSASLEDYKGKVVLLNFWSPACESCIAEFQHIENVLQKFEGKDIACLGINVSPEQDEYVLPFLQARKFNFTPLKATEWAVKTYKVSEEQTNFLIDQRGRIISSGFRVNDPHSEAMLELMIRALVEEK